MHRPSRSCRPNQAEKHGTLRPTGTTQLTEAATRHADIMATVKAQYDDMMAIAKAEYESELADEAATVKSFPDHCWQALTEIDIFIYDLNPEREESVGPSDPEPEGMSASEEEALYTKAAANVLVVLKDIANETMAHSSFPQSAMPSTQFAKFSTEYL